MKKLRLFAFLLMTSTAVSTISLRLLAQDCTGQSNCNNKIINTKENNLKEILIAQKSPIPLKNSSQGITSSTSPSKSSSPSSQLPPTDTKVNSQEWSSSLPLVFSLLGIVSGIGGAIFSVLALNHHKKLLDRQNKKMADLENKSSLSSQKITKNFEVYDLTITQKLNAISKQIQELHSKYEALQEKVKQVNNLSLLPVLDSTPVPYAVSQPIIPLREIDEVISRFNSQDTNYFHNSRFHPIKLSSESIKGEVGTDVRRIIRFELAASSQEAYLEFSADGENWLILNITSPYFNKILNQLSENIGIFAINLGSGNNQLVKPAKLKSVGSGIWEIAEPGEFQ